MFDGRRDVWMFEFRMVGLGMCVGGMCGCLN